MKEFDLLEALKGAPVKLACGTPVVELWISRTLLDRPVICVTSNGTLLQYDLNGKFGITPEQQSEMADLHLQMV